MTLSISTTKWTVDDYHQMVEAGILSDRQVELLNGVIINMAPEGTSHAAYSQDFADYLRAVLGNRVRIREAKPVTLSPNSEPEPDIAVVAPHPVSLYVEHHPYPADIFWVIEYSDSSLTKDLDEKSVIYAAAGIAEYWVVNLKTKELILFREPQSEGYKIQTSYSSETIIPLAFPDISIPVSQLVNG